MGTYKVNLEGGFSHIIKTDIVNIEEFVNELVFKYTYNCNSYFTTWDLHSPNEYKQDKVAIISSKVISVEYYKEV